MSSRTIWAITLVAVAALGLFWARFYKDSYEIIPINSSKEITSDPEFADWFQFTAPANEFQVSLPLLPQQASQHVSDPKTQVNRHYEIYAAQKADGTIFMISRISFADIAPDTSVSDMMKDVMDDMTRANPKNKLNDVKSVDFKGLPAKEFTIQNEDTTIYAREFAKDKTIYILSAIAKNENANKKEFEHFVKSFTFKNKDKEKDVPLTTPFPPQT